MKLGPVTKLYKKNQTMAKAIDNDLMSKICDAIVTFPVCGQFGAILEPYLGRIVCETYINLL